MSSIRWFAAGLFASLMLMATAAAGAAGAAERDADVSPLPAQVLVLLQLPPPHFRPDGNYSGVYADNTGRAARRRIALSLANAHGLSLSADWPLPLLGLDCYVMDVPPALRPDQVVQQLAHDPRVAWAQTMNRFHGLGHDDPLYPNQPAAHSWQLDALHAVATGRGVRIAIVDSAVQADHPDLAGQLAERTDLLDDAAPAGETHGTAVAGIVAARADDRQGIAGIAPHARLLALRACRQAGAETVCHSLGLALALHAAIEHRAQVINLSLGGPPDRLIGALIQAALGRGIAVVAAVDRHAPRGGFPAALAGVIAVAEAPVAARADAWLAPGSDVPTTLPGSRWGLVSGASYAAAHVSGLLALMLEARLRSHASAGSGAAALASGSDGRLDACASLRRAGAADACLPDALSSARVTAPH